MALIILKPADGSRVVQVEGECVLFGQPPEVLKGLLLNKIMSFDTLVLTDVHEKDGSLLNNLEYPLYFFLFIAKSLEQGRVLNLVGSQGDISRALRLLRLTLLGPTPTELDDWDTWDGLKQEWLDAAEYLALKNETGEIRDVESFFQLIPFKDGEARTEHCLIRHLGRDSYETASENEVWLRGSVTIR